MHSYSLPQNVIFIKIIVKYDCDNDWPLLAELCIILQLQKEYDIL